MISIDTNGQNVTFATALTSSGGTLTLNDTNGGPGTLTLTGGGGSSWGNTYSGGSTVNAGTLKLNLTSQSNGTALSLGTVTVNSSGTLQLFTSVSNNTALLSTGTIFTGAGVITVVAGTGDVDFWGPGPGATVVKNFSGLIDVKTGTLSDQTDGGGATAWSTSTTGMTLEVDSGALFDLRTDSPVVGGLTGSGTIGSTYNSQTLTVGANNATGATFGGVIQNLLTGSPGYSARGQVIALTKIGTGTQILSGANTYSGGTTVSGGNLLQGVANALGSTNGALTVNTGGTLDLGGFALGVGNLTGTGGTITDTGAGATLMIGTGNGGGGNYAGVIQDGTGSLSLTKIGTATITLSGIAANTYSGLTTVSAGSLVASKSAGVVAIPGNITLNNVTTSNLWFTANGQLGGSGVLTYSGASSNARFYLEGTTQSLAGINESNAIGIIENSESGVAGPSNSGTGTLTLTGSGSYSFNGYLRT